jgi:hypothetical protein
VLGGYVEWVVYAAGSFPSTYSGYTPTAGELVYAYQMFNTGDAPISQYMVYLNNDAADNHGSFNTGVAARWFRCRRPEDFVESAWWDPGEQGNPHWNSAGRSVKRWCLQRINGGFCVNHYQQW